MKGRRGLLAAIAAAVLMMHAAATPRSAIAHSYKLGQIAIGHIWAPPVKADAEGAAVYAPLLNHGDAPVRLVGASTSVAESVRFRVEKEGEVRWLDAVTLPPGKPVTLAAWREHIWLVGLKQPLKEGATFDLTLDFGPAGRITVQVMVERTAAGH